MHLLKKNKRNALKRRRGLSFIEVISSMLIIALLTGMVLGIVSVMSQSTKEALEYTELKIYEMKRLEEIRNDLEMSMEYLANPIDTVDYSEIDAETGIVANIEIESVGTPFNKELYLVKMTVHKSNSQRVIKSQTLLRGGCTAHEP